MLLRRMWTYQKLWVVLVSKTASNWGTLNQRHKTYHEPLSIMTKSTLAYQSALRYTHRPRTPLPVTETWLSFNTASNRPHYITTTQLDTSSGQWSVFRCPLLTTAVQGESCGVGRIPCAVKLGYFIRLVALSTLSGTVRQFDAWYDAWVLPAQYGGNAVNVKGIYIIIYVKHNHTFCEGKNSVRRRLPHLDNDIALLCINWLTTHFNYEIIIICMWWQTNMMWPCLDNCLFHKYWL